MNISPAPRGRSHRQPADFDRNRQIIAEIEEELARGGGAGPDAPDAAELIRQARAEADAKNGVSPAVTGGEPISYRPAAAGAPCTWAASGAMTWSASRLTPRRVLEENERWNSSPR